VLVDSGFDFDGATTIIIVLRSTTLSAPSLLMKLKTNYVVVGLTICENNRYITLCVFFCLVLLDRYEVSSE
jgi:hypothetical protein